MISEIELYNIVDSLFADEADLLRNALSEKLIRKDNNQKIIHRERTTLICPKCGNSKIYKNGKTKTNNQKYICCE